MKGSRKGGKRVLEKLKMYNFSDYIRELMIITWRGTQQEASEYTHMYKVVIQDTYMYRVYTHVQSNPGYIHVQSIHTCTE